MKLLATVPAIAALLMGSNAIAYEAHLNAQAQSKYWLVLTHGYFGNTYQSDSKQSVAVPMNTLEGCMEEGKKWDAVPLKSRRGFRESHCVESR